MTDTFNIAVESLAGDIRTLDIISQNLANVNTNGYKREIPVTGTFATLQQGELDALYEQRSSQASVVPDVQSYVDHTEGMLRKTGNPLDIAIEGEGYFRFSSPEGNVYSRLASLSVDHMGRLVNSQGYPVMADEGELFVGNGEIAIAKDGVLTEAGSYIGTISIVNFEDKTSLQKTGNGSFTAPPGAAPFPVDSVNVLQGYAETSNVSPLNEMVKMMSTLRHFEATANVLRGYDQMLGSAISTLAEF